MIKDNLELMIFKEHSLNHMEYLSILKILQEFLVVIKSNTEMSQRSLDILMRQENNLIETHIIPNQVLTCKI